MMGERATTGALEYRPGVRDPEGNPIELWQPKNPAA
jgi:hypothetical protein